MELKKLKDECLEADLKELRGDKRRLGEIKDNGLETSNKSIVL